MFPCVGLRGRRNYYVTPERFRINSDSAESLAYFCSLSRRPEGELSACRVHVLVMLLLLGPGLLSRYSDSVRAGRSGDQISVGARFFAPVQTGPGAHPASYTMATGSCFPVVTGRGRGVDHPPSSNAKVKERVELHLPVISGSMSARHGASSGCGWRNGLEIRRVAANMLNKQLRTADKEWSSSLVVGRGANNSSP